MFDLAKLQDTGFILSLSAADLQRLTRLSAGDVAALHTAVAEAVPHPAPVTGIDCCLCILLNLGMYKIPISQICPEPDLVGFVNSDPAGAIARLENQHKT